MKRLDKSVVEYWARFAHMVVPNNIRKMANEEASIDFEYSCRVSLNFGMKFIL